MTFLILWSREGRSTKQFIASLSRLTQSTLVSLRALKYDGTVLTSIYIRDIRSRFDERHFLAKNTARPVVQRRRIATQRITGVDDSFRLVATVIEPPCYFADSTNSIVLADNANHTLVYLLALLNSRLYQWRFHLTSTNNNVGTNELECLPVSKT